MRQWAGKRYWLVGASEGLGRAVAQKMSAAGTELILSARNEARLQELADELPGKATPVAVDISNDDSVAAAAQQVGEIDGFVFLAGVYWPMSAREWKGPEATQMVDINFTGAVRTLGHVVPGMVARDAGHIVITGSLSGFRGVPGAIGYGASKAACMSLAESMHYDLKKTGVDMQLINPGYVRTRLTDKNEITMPFIMEPEEAATRFVEAMNTNRFKTNYPWAFGTFFRSTMFMPDWMYYRVFG
ncbi:MAG: SDR family NAD(P)-dependent oxidoreductase [Pseudomonadota bacterium]